MADYTAPGELWNPTTVPTQSERQPFHWSSSRGASSAYGLRQGMAQNRSLGMLMDYGASYDWSERNPPWLPQVLRSEAILALLWLDEQAAAAAHSETCVASPGVAVTSLVRGFSRKVFSPLSC